ncbi:MAG: hypothetical protein MHM6MM_002391 [Cercozoa sp. M6MM]
MPRLRESEISIDSLVDELDLEGGTLSSAQEVSLSYDSYTHEDSRRQFERSRTGGRRTNNNRRSSDREEESRQVYMYREEKERDKTDAAQFLMRVLWLQFLVLIMLGCVLPALVFESTSVAPVLFAASFLVTPVALYRYRRKLSLSALKFLLLFLCIAALSAWTFSLAMDYAKQENFATVERLDDASLASTVTKLRELRDRHGGYIVNLQDGAGVNYSRNVAKSVSNKSFLVSSFCCMAPVLSGNDSDTVQHPVLMAVSCSEDCVYSHPEEWDHARHLVSDHGRSDGDLRLLYSALRDKYALKTDFEDTEFVWAGEPMALHYQRFGLMALGAMSCVVLLLASHLAKSMCSGTATRPRGPCAHSDVVGTSYASAYSTNTGTYSTYTTQTNTNTSYTESQLSGSVFFV